MFVSAASAEELSRFDEKVIMRSIQCEFGRAADEVYAIAPRKMLVGKVTWTRDESNSKAVEGNLSALARLFGTGGYTDERGASRGATVWRNLHNKNKEACNDRNLVNLLIDDCLKKQAEYLRVEGQTITCGSYANGTLLTKAGISGDLWIVNASVSGTYSKKWSYKIEVLVPSERPTPAAAPPPVVPSPEVAFGVGSPQPDYWRAYAGPDQVPSGSRRRIRAATASR
jgi:hypothetical protein